MPTPAPRRRTQIPAPRPLSPRAAALVRDTFAQEAERSRVVQKAVTAALTSVQKADKPQTAVFDQGGKLIGICDPADITPVAGSHAQDKPAKGKQQESAAAPGPQMGGATPAAQAGAPVEPADDEQMQKGGRVRKAMTGSHSAVEQADLSNALMAAGLAAITTVQKRARDSQARARRS